MVRRIWILVFPLALVLSLLSPAVLSAQEACPRRASFWEQQCVPVDPCGNAPDVCHAGMENLWRCAITETDVLQWRKNDSSFETTASVAALSNANLFTVLCSQLAGPGGKSVRDAAETEYLALILNICSGALPLDANIVSKGFTGTVLTALDAIENALNTNQNLDFWTRVAGQINKSVGVDLPECTDADGLFAGIPPCGS